MLLGPQRFFGAARWAEEGCSPAVLATALVEAGRRADGCFLEKLESTGDMEFRLGRGPASRRIFPVVDIGSCGTRRHRFP
ncbi:hypothetical protein ACIRP3_00750 [Streptomyces sp. NPDC101209]|uniref:hypothetical protein n=1 Tax=Streptomyces sp. NPDC101209 TaxID=3366129 RepID=UPI00380097BE